MIIAGVLTFIIQRVLSCQMADISPEKIRAVRTKLEETRVVFAARFGVTPTTIYRWETRGVPDHGPTRMAVERLFQEVSAA